MEKRAYSKREFLSLGFPAKEYDFPTGRGCFTGKMVMKRWINYGIVCYFETEGGTRYKLCVWRDFKNEYNGYHPANSELDISNVPFDTTLQVSYEESKSGKTKWLTAEIIEP